MKSGSRPSPRFVHQTAGLVQSGGRATSGGIGFVKIVGQCGTTNSQPWTQNRAEARAWLVRRQASRAVPFWVSYKKKPMPVSWIDIGFRPPAVVPGQALRDWWRAGRRDNMRGFSMVGMRGRESCLTLHVVAVRRLHFCLHSGDIDQTSDDPFLLPALAQEPSRQCICITNRLSWGLLERFSSSSVVCDLLRRLCRRAIRGAPGGLFNSPALHAPSG